MTSSSGKIERLTWYQAIWEGYREDETPKDKTKKKKIRVAEKTYGLVFAKKSRLHHLCRHGALVLMDSTHRTNALGWKLYTLMIRTGEVVWLPVAHMLVAVENAQIVAEGLRKESMLLFLIAILIARRFESGVQHGSSVGCSATIPLLNNSLFDLPSLEPYSETSETSLTSSAVCTVNAHSIDAGLQPQKTPVRTRFAGTLWRRYTIEGRREDVRNL